MVSHIDEETSVTCPLPQAAFRLRHYFREYGNADGDAMRLTLGVDIAVPGANVALAVKRAVIATIQPHHLSADMAPRYRVQWAPEVPGPLPLFTGELIVCGASDFDTFSLRLSGTYAPPLGIFGQGFDLAIGHRIAVATASDLLHRIKISVERDFQEDEARKR